MVSPVDGFVGRRYLDPGAYVTSNTAVVSVVDISLVRMVANLVERDLRLVEEGVRAQIEVDAFPSEMFDGRIARIAPVLDPATRTAEIEIEVPNTDFRLKPGMYARVSLVVGAKSQALVVPREAVVLRTTARGVFRVDETGGAPTAQFVALAIGLEDEQYVEVGDGIAEGDRVVTTGAAGLQHGDPILLADAGGRGGGPPGRDAAPGAMAGRGAGPAGRGAAPGAMAGRGASADAAPGRGARSDPVAGRVRADEAVRQGAPVDGAPPDAAPDPVSAPRNTVLEALGITPAPARAAEPPALPGATAEQAPAQDASPAPVR